ncbi:unnamed protein product [Closterium sp. NIES-54]
MKCYDTDAAFSPSLVPPAQLPVMPAGATAGYQPALVEMALDPQQQQQQQEEEQGGQEEEQQQHQTPAITVGHQPSLQDTSHHCSIWQPDPQQQQQQQEEEQVGKREENQEGQEEEQEGRSSSTSSKKY